MSEQVKWQTELELLKTIIRKSGLTETIKWGTEVYTHKGKNVVGLVGLKNYVAVWFYNGVFLKDPKGILINAQDSKTKALRQWRINSVEQIDEDLLLEYILEAIENEEAGRFWKPEKPAPPAIPDLLQNAFNEDPGLKEAFEKLTPYKQKDYIEHIALAKRQETALARLEKILPMIRQGIGLNDKYKRC